MASLPFKPQYEVGGGGGEGSEQEKCDRFQASAEEREERNGVKQQISPSF